MAKVNESFSVDLYKYVPLEVRRQDISQGLLVERLLGGPQQVWEAHVLLLEALATLHDVGTIDDAYLTYLKWQVGWTSELDYITDQLTSDELRKLIRVSADLWKQKGTEEGIKNTIRVLTGRSAIIDNWFRRRWILGQTGLWRLGAGTDPILVGQSEGEHDEYLSIIWIMNEVGIARALIQDAVELMRPLQEVYDVVYADLVDDFRLGRSKWVTDALPDVVWDAVAFTLTLSPGTTIRTNATAIEEAEDVCWRQRITFKGPSAGAHQLEFRRDPDADNLYRATWEQDGTVTLERVNGGISTVVATASSVGPFPEDVSMVVGVNVTRATAARLRVSVIVYDDVILSGIFSEPNIFPPGQWRIANSSSIDIELDDVIAFALPVEVDRVRASGVTTRGDTGGAVSPTVVYDNLFNYSPWTLTGLWHTSSFRYITVPVSIYFGTGESGYHTWGVPGDMGGIITAGTATSANIDLTDYPADKYRLFLEWWQYGEIRLDPGVDVGIVLVRVAGVTVQTISKSDIWGSGTGVQVVTGFQRHEITDAVAGLAAVSVRYSMDTVDAPTAGSDGWFADRTRIVAEQV